MGRPHASGRLALLKSSQTRFGRLELLCPSSGVTEGSLGWASKPGSSASLAG